MSMAEQIAYAQQKRSHLKEDENQEIQHLRQVNKMLEEQRTQLLEEMSVIKWYMTVMEDGKDSRFVLEDYVNT